MSVIDLLTRVDALCQKYEKYDLDKQRDQQQISGGDAFLKLYTVFETQLAAIAQKANDAETEKNRAVTATLNAEIRRAKADLRDELPKLEKLANRKVKGLSKEDLAARADLVLALTAKIDAIPDGGIGGNKPSAWGGKAAGSRMEIKIDNTDPDYIMRPEHYQQTNESNQFRQEYEMRKRRQDEGLDKISEGLATLRNMAADINEELDRQVPLMDEIDTKVDKATSDLRNTNVRLKETVTKLRSSRNFCIDIILLCVILGIAAYLYNVLKK